ncbi:MAG: hypothetical protein IT214_04545 [Chitinophagaceae bacterium]|jgi:phenylacetate-coenzyme A ligase PaaK-like adenylate-forming protein|nr:hypothetical protein [Chitinophagaceae bacterium]OQY93792.1 MAG: hypothetical protein B6D37_10035 [Sphingobacteriales bacterium UTBCD1]
MNYWKKYWLAKIIHFTPQYLYYKRRIKRKKHISNDNDIYRVIEKVPFYRKKGYKKDKINNYPCIRKSDIAGNEEEFISDKISRKYLFKKTTGGTSGNTLNFYKTVNEVIKEEAYVNDAFSLIGKNLRIAVLRGNKPASGIYEFKYGHLLLSSYQLSKQNVLEYINLINKFKVNCLHVYPSSFRIFCKYLKEIVEEGNLGIPGIKGILSSSEVLLTIVKKEIMELFPQATLIDRYGQTEHAALAISINDGYYQFDESYSKVEFMDTGLTNDKYSIKEIVGTQINNKAMPLVRYRTGDFVQVDGKGNIIGIIGRTNEFIVNKNRELLPCIIAAGRGVMENILSAQYFQDTVGVLIFRVKVNEKFSEVDRKNILEEFNSFFFGQMEIKVQVVDDFEKTSGGKHIRAIQKLNLDDFR